MSPKKNSALSGGQKQRFTIILVMMQDALLTFYDEVTSGLDFETRERLMERLVKWYEHRKSALCIVSHYYEELELLADKLLLLDKGKVIDFVKKEELFRKYCGNAVLLVYNSRENQALLQNLYQLHAPEHLIAVRCRTTEEEREASALLIGHNVNFKRSNNDIELMFVNAKARYYEGGN